MTDPAYDQAFWEALWTRTLATHAEHLAHRPPASIVLETAASLPPGRALDAGCGHGAEALWLASRGWQVLGVDFSASALAHARAMADGAGLDVAWQVADLGTWAPPPAAFALVTSLYVHCAEGAFARVERLAAAVAPGGTLLLVGHQPVDPATGAPTRAAGQVQVSVEAARAALDAARWRLVVAEERPRAGGGGVDAVIVARRLA